MTMEYYMTVLSKAMKNTSSMKFVGHGAQGFNIAKDLHFNEGITRSPGDAAAYLLGTGMAMAQFLDEICEQKTMTKMSKADRNGLRKAMQRMTTNAITLLDDLDDLEKEKDQ